MKVTNFKSFIIIITAIHQMLAYKYSLKNYVKFKKYIILFEMPLSRAKKLILFDNYQY